MSDNTWHEDDEFWELSAAWMFGEGRLAQAREECDHVQRLLCLEAGDSILDLACGVGRHSLELARRGFRVTGVDRMASYLRRARDRAAAEGLSVEFIKADMRRFSRPDSYHGVICLGNSFGVFEEIEEERQVLENVHVSLKGGGWFVLELTGKEVMKRLFRPHDSYQDAEMSYEESRKVDGDWEGVTTKLTIRQGEKRRDFTYSYRLYSASELTGLLDDVGFNEVRVLGGLDGRPYDDRATKLVLVAQK